MNIDNNIPVFTKEKLKELLHYTDMPDNPTYDAFNSKCFYKIYSGAKGVSKSFGRMIETIYRFVNENIFCSVWCRNQYNHIRTTLRPMLEKVLFYLAEEHDLDYRPYIYITNEAAYWKYDDGGLDRAIYFQNWEKIQAFQGFTLKNKNFRFGELVIDEPLEDTSDTKKLPHELMELYQVQKEKLPLLIQNTVLREAAPDNFNINVSFLYNIFTTEHFLLQDYHIYAIPFLNEFNEPNETVLNELLNKKYLQNENKDFADGLGLIVTMFTKFFVPAKELNISQIKNLQLLKEQNYRLWLITVAGFAFNQQNTTINYFMKDILFDENSNFKKQAINFISKNKFLNYFKNGEIIGLYHGFDPGIHDNAALVSSALLKDGSLVVFQVINDVKDLINKKTIFLNKAINSKVVDLVKKWNLVFEKIDNSGYISKNFPFSRTSLLFSDSHPTLEQINIFFLENKVNSQANKAVRKSSQFFGIIERQEWQRFIFQNKKILFVKNYGGENLIRALAKQVVVNIDDNQKRDETINPEIYDVINAFEMSASLAFKYQYLVSYEQKEQVQGGWNGI